MANKAVAVEEVELRVERAELPGKIARASRQVEVLRGEGHHRESPELNRAVEEVRELQGRERALPGLIAAAVSKRCRIQAQRLARERRELVPERDALEAEARAASNRALMARRAATEARVRMEAVEGRMDRLSQEATPYEVFAQRADAFQGQPQKLLRLLEDARASGLLLPLDHRSPPETNGH